MNVPMRRFLARIKDFLFPVHAGVYELWWAHDDSQSSLFKPANCKTHAQYYSLIHSFGYGDGEPEFEGDHKEDIIMTRVARFWVPHVQIAKLVRLCYERWRL